MESVAWRHFRKFKKNCEHNICNYVASGDPTHKHVHNPPAHWLAIMHSSSLFIYFFFKSPSSRDVPSTCLSFRYTLPSHQMTPWQRPHVKQSKGMEFDSQFRVRWVSLGMKGMYTSGFNCRNLLQCLQRDVNHSAVCYFNHHDRFTGIYWRECIMSLCMFLKT